MGKQKTTKEFIKEVSIIHNNFYHYDKTIYIRSNIHVIITCPIHGDFEQVPLSHKSGNGCPKCGREKCDKNRKVWTEESFREKVSELHPSLVFDKTVYTNPKEKVLYECAYHGEKSTYPYNLLKGCGCRQCASQKPIVSNEEWVKRFKDCNCENISYDKIPNSFKSEEHITFVCNIHGEFEQTPLNHLKSCCPKCGFNRSRNYHIENPIGWNFHNWQKGAEKSKNFDSFKVYIIRCWNDEEEFYKIGKTFTTLELRFRKSLKSKMPYNYEVIKIIESKTDGLYISKLEKELQKSNKQNKYLPKLVFEGMFECFSKII